MPLTTSGLSVDSANPIYKKRYEDISFAFSFAASASIDWTGLTLKGQLRDVSDVLLWDSGIPQQTRRDIHFFLEYSNFIERGQPLIAQLAPGVGVTGSQIDELFRAAAEL